MQQHRSVAFVSTYPPTRCGLATFTSSLVGAVAHARGTAGGLGVLRLVPARDEDAPAAGVLDHRTGDPASLRRAVAWLRTFDAVSVQHEFGIYGGRDGREVLDLVAAVDVPVVTTLHTVREHPTLEQRAIVEELARRSRRVVVMSGAAREVLVRTHDVDAARVEVVPHGVSRELLGPAVPSAPVRRPGSRPLVLTWGLIGPGKGLEAAIEGCLQLAALEPTPRYVIAGATHPEVRRTSGERYRDGLVALVDRLGLRDVVSFDDRYLDAAELAGLVRDADVVLLPYESAEQVTSGVLVEAVAAGCPVVATEFPHARELLPGRAGITVPHGDPAALGRAVHHVLGHPQVAGRMRREAARAARGWSWPSVAATYERLLAAPAGAGRDRPADLAPAR